MATQQHSTFARLAIDQQRQRAWLTRTGEFDVDDLICRKEALVAISGRSMRACYS